MILEILIVALIGYVLGTSNMAFYLSKIKKVDMRNSGSGNLGASNAVIVLGKGFGILTFLHDALKPVLAGYIANLIFPGTEFLPVVAAVMTSIGHMYPFWLKFKGGKGFAAYMGALIVLDWRYFLVAFIAAILITILSDYIVFGTLTVTVVTPIFALFTNGVIACIFFAIASICIIWKHRENFVKFKNGTEIGFKSAVSGKHKKT